MAIAVTFLDSDAAEGGLSFYLTTANVLVAGTVVLIAIASDNGGVALGSRYYYDGTNYDDIQSGINWDVQAVNSGNVETEILRWVATRANTTSGRIYIHLGGAGNKGAGAAYKVTGLAASPFDKSGTATGNGTSQAVNTSANPTNVGDLAICITGNEIHNDHGYGSWESDSNNDVHENVQGNGTTGGGSAANISMSAALSLVDVTSAVCHGHNTWPESVDYAIAIGTYKIGGTNTPQSVGGASLTPSSTVSKLPNKKVGLASVQPSGTVSKATTKSTKMGAASLTPSGTVNKLTALSTKMGAASLTPTGSLGTTISFGESVGGGSITPVGTLVRNIGKAVGSAALTPVAAIVRLTSIRTGSASVTPAGTVTKGTNKATKMGAADLTPSGTLATLMAFGESVGGAELTPLGTLLKNTAIRVGWAELTPAKGLTRKTGKPVGSAEVTPEGSLDTLLSVAQDVGGANLTPVGILTTLGNFARAVGGAILTPVATLVTRYLMRSRPQPPAPDRKQMLESMLTSTGYALPVSRDEHSLLQAIVLALGGSLAGHPDQHQLWQRILAAKGLDWANKDIYQMEKALYEAVVGEGAAGLDEQQLLYGLATKGLS